MIAATPDDPKISIGMVVYNGARHIRRALQSVADQSARNIELIVVDGGSTDGTLEILHEYAEHVSVLVSEPDRGIYDAMNKVCGLATGDWLLFMGCDDELLDVIHDVSRFFSRADCAYYGDVVFLHSGEVYGGRFSRRRLMRQNICHQALFYPRAVYAGYRYSLDYPLLADYAYNIRLMGDAVPFVYIPRVIAVFNERGSATGRDADFQRDRRAILRAAFGNLYILLDKLHVARAIMREGAAKVWNMIFARGPSR